MTWPHNLDYPNTRRLTQTETIHGHQVSDPYRWLEDAASEETKAWLAAQDDLFASQAGTWQGRDVLAARIRELLGAGYVSPPVWRADRQFFMRRTAEQEHAVLLAADQESGERTLLDPMAIDASGSTTLDSWQPDKEGRLLAYQLSEGGNEESVLRVMDVASGQIVDGPIDRCRYSPVAWLPGGKAFYYVRRLPADTVPPGEDQYHRRVYLHQLGTPPGQDVMVFGADMEKTNYYGVSVSHDGHWLMVTASRGTAPRNDLWLADLTACDPATPELVVVQEGLDAQTSAYAGRDGRLYMFTDYGAPRGKLAVADPADPRPGSWRDLISEDPEAVLGGYGILDGPELDRPVLLARWTRHAISEITVHDLASGERTGAVPLPGLGSASGISEHPDGGHEAWFSYTDHVTPTSVHRYDAVTGQTTLWARPPGTVAVPPAQTRQLSYESADGTEVRMTVTFRADLPNPRPTILYGYGGFGLSLTPGYSASTLAWVEAGGVYAVAGLRGGGEEGEDWHRAGMLDRKQNVFDDFHAAAGKLIAEGWTTREQLAVSGGSNGGLLVGAAITQRPEMFAAALCSAPLLDMVRYERFGLGQTWNVEYGSAGEPGQLGWLLSYSPYHHVREGTSYPATLFTVFDSDTRVDPMHARKMCAALQHATASDRPILLRREAEVGHGARAVSRAVAVAAESLAFLAHFTGLAIRSPGSPGS
ncbi:MAG: prolyl oligopeptidase family serine peptidase [Micromonosporaceae bacterium]